MCKKSNREFLAMASIKNTIMLMEQVNIQIEHLENHLDDIECLDGIENLKKFLNTTDVIMAIEIIKIKQKNINLICSMLDGNNYQ